MQQIACGSHPRPYTSFKDELLEHWKSVKVSRCDATIAGACLQNERWDKCRAFFSRIGQTRAAESITISFTVATFRNFSPGPDVPGVREAYPITFVCLNCFVTIMIVDNVVLRPPRLPQDDSEVSITLMC